MILFEVFVILSHNCLAIQHLQQPQHQSPQTQYRNTRVAPMRNNNGISMHQYHDKRQLYLIIIRITQAIDSIIRKLNCSKVVVASILYVVVILHVQIEIKLNRIPFWFCSCMVYYCTY